MRCVYERRRVIGPVNHQLLAFCTFLFNSFHVSISLTPHHTTPHHTTPHHTTPHHTTPHHTTPHHTTPHHTTPHHTTPHHTTPHHTTPHHTTAQCSNAMYCSAVQYAAVWSDCSPCILIHTLYATPRSQRKHQFDCNTIFRGRVRKLCSKCFIRIACPKHALKLKCPHRI